jgi:hypothetical protein
MFVTLKQGALEKFTSRLEAIFGSITTLSYLRKGRPKVIDFQKFKQKALK